MVVWPKLRHPALCFGSKIMHFVCTGRHSTNKLNHHSKAETYIHKIRKIIFSVQKRFSLICPNFGQEGPNWEGAHYHTLF